MGTQRTFRVPCNNFLLFFLVFIIHLRCLCSTRFPVQYSITGYQMEDLQSENRLAELFKLWREQYGKVYQRTEEMVNRFENFKRNLKYIVEKNSNRTGHTVGLNRFADLSNEEFRETYMSKVKRPGRFGHRKVRLGSLISTCDAPTSLDWRRKGVVTAVKNQGSCGSCWAFSSTGAIEGINAINTGELISLSEQELVDCDTTDDGCDGGYMDSAYEWVINNGGIDTESDYPYIGIGGTCSANKEVNKVVSIVEYKDVEESDTALLCAAVNQPVSVGIDGSSWDFQLYTGGIYEGDCSSDPDDIDHAVLIVGYASQGDKDYWIVKNSWGTSWGIEGYIYIRRDTDLPYGVCAINAQASYPIQSSAAPSPYPSPSSPPPPPPPYYPPPPPPPPPPPSPSPTDCGDLSYCPASETCCCLKQFFGTCLIYGCCEYTNAVCCLGTDYCCPHDYPICDINEGLCLKKSGDYIGIAAKKKTMAKHKLPWINSQQNAQEMSYQPLQWRRNPFAAP